MQVAISVFGRFHAFYLAQQLQKREALAQLITSYPRFKTSYYGLARKKVTSLLALEAVRRFTEKIPPFEKTHFFQHWAYDSLAATQLRGGTDLFVGWAGSSLQTLKRAKQLGMIAIVEARLSHPDPRIQDRETREYETADYITVPNTFAKRLLLEKGVRAEKIVHIPYGVNLSLFKPKARGDRKFRFLYVGNLDERSGVARLIEAFQQLNLSDTELWLVGAIDPKLSPKIAKAVNAHPNIVLHGPKKHRTLSEYFSQCSVTVLPSTKEAFTTTAAESMACGIPVVCTDSSPGSDLVRNEMEGFVVKGDDLESLQAKLVWCYHHPDQCYAMGQAARERMRTGFTWDDFGKRIYLAYSRMLETKSELGIGRLENSRSA